MDQHVQHIAKPKASIVSARKKHSTKLSENVYLLVRQTTDKLIWKLSIYTGNTPIKIHGI